MEFLAYFKLGFNDICTQGFMITFLSVGEGFKLLQAVYIFIFFIIYHILTGLLGPYKEI